MVQLREREKANRGFCSRGTLFINSQGTLFIFESQKNKEQLEPRTLTWFQQRFDLCLRQNGRITTSFKITIFEKSRDARRWKQNESS